MLLLVFVFVYYCYETTDFEGRFFRQMYKMDIPQWEFISKNNILLVYVVQRNEVDVVVMMTKSRIMTMVIMVMMTMGIIMMIMVVMMIPTTIFATTTSAGC